MPNQVISAFNVEDGGAWSRTADGTEFSYRGEPDIWNCYVDWNAFPGTELKAGFSGRWTAGAGQAITARVRVGGIRLNAQNDGAPFGDERLAMIIGAGATADLGSLSAAFAKPSGAYRRSKVMLTHQAAASVTSDLTGGVLSLIPTNGFGQGILLSNGASAGGGGDALEQVPDPVSGYTGMNWLVDFDQFENAGSLVVGFAGAVASTPPYSNNVYRVRIGGTFGVADGTIAVTWIDDGAASPVVGGERLGGDMATIPNTFSGTQVVKLSMQNTASDGMGIQKVSILIREA